MISSFEYLSPVQKAYSKVVEAENQTSQNGFNSNIDSNPNQNPNQNPSMEERKEADEVLDSKKGNPCRMDDNERRLFYQDEIKRLTLIQKYYEQQRRRQVNGQ